MHQENEVKLTGLISKIYPPMITPAGVKVARIVLEHSSEQMEGGALRYVKCRIYCVYVAAEINQELLNHHVSVTGFLSVNTQKKLVLHITNLKNLD